jgi:hypothetical protein
MSSQEHQKKEILKALSKKKAQQRKTQKEKEKEYKEVQSLVKTIEANIALNYGNPSMAQKSAEDAGKLEKMKPIMIENEKEYQRATDDLIDTTLLENAVKKSHTIQHLSPAYISKLKEALSKTTEEEGSESSEEEMQLPITPKKTPAKQPATPAPAPPPAPIQEEEQKPKKPRAKKVKN